MDLHRGHRRPVYTLGLALVDPFFVELFYLALYAKLKPKYFDCHNANRGPVDVIISLAWFAAFGLLVDSIHQIPRCHTFDWHFPGSDHSLCTRWKAAEAFSFLSAILWLVSALVVGFPRGGKHELPTDETTGPLVYIPVPQQHRWTVSYALAFYLGCPSTYHANSIQGLVAAGVALVLLLRPQLKLGLEHLRRLIRAKEYLNKV